MKDNRFILSLTEAALDAYEQAVKSGSNPKEAVEQANTVLFNGLHFSKYDTLKNILWDEFSNQVPEDEAGDFAIRLLPECENNFAQYPLLNSFTHKSEY